MLHFIVVAYFSYATECGVFLQLIISLKYLCIISVRYCTIRGNFGLRQIRYFKTRAIERCFIF